jgi:hypothetical protein
MGRADPSPCSVARATSTVFEAGAGYEVVSTGRRVRPQRSRGREVTG